MGVLYLSDISKLRELTDPSAYCPSFRLPCRLVTEEVRMSTQGLWHFVQEALVCGYTGTQTFLVLHSNIVCKVYH